MTTRRAAAPSPEAPPRATRKANPFTKPEAVKPTVMAVVYGPEKVGKTYLALKDTPRPLAVLDTEGSAQFYVGRDGFEPFDLLHTKSYRQVVEALDWIEANPGTYASVVLDSISVLYSVLQDAAVAARTARVVRDGGDPADVDIEMREWGRIKRLNKALMARLMNLGVNVIVTARERDVTERRGSEMVKTGVKPDADKGIGYDAALIVRLSRNGSGRKAEVLGDWSGVHGQGAEIADPTWDSLFLPLVARRAGTKVAHVQPDAEAAHQDATSMGTRLATPLEAAALAEALTAAGYEPDEVRAKKGWPAFTEMGAVKVQEMTDWARAKADKAPAPQPVEEPISEYEEAVA